MLLTWLLKKRTKKLKEDLGFKEKNLSLKKLHNYMQQAEIVSKNSPDKQTKVGCILVRKEDGSLVGSGYNGFIRGCADEYMPTKRPDKYPITIHAEENALLNCNLNGLSTKGSIAIITLSPCLTCIRRLFQAGINEIYFDKTYRDFEINQNSPDIELDLMRYGIYNKITVKPREY